MEARKNFEIRVFFPFAVGATGPSIRAHRQRHALSLTGCVTLSGTFSWDRNMATKRKKRKELRKGQENRIDWRAVRGLIFLFVASFFSLSLGCFFPLPSQTPTNQSSKAQRESERAFPLSLSSLFLLFRLQKGRRASYKSH